MQDIKLAGASLRVCEPLGQTQSFGDAGSMFGFGQTGHGWAIYGSRPQPCPSGARWRVISAASLALPWGSDGEAGGLKSPVPSDDLDTLATRGCYTPQKQASDLRIFEDTPWLGYSLCKENPIGNYCG